MEVLILGVIHVLQTRFLLLYAVSYSVYRVKHTNLFFYFSCHDPPTPHTSNDSCTSVASAMHIANIGVHYTQNRETTGWTGKQPVGPVKPYKEHQLHNKWEHDLGTCHDQHPIQETPQTGYTGSTGYKPD